MTRLVLDLFGNVCNDAPKFTVKIDNEILWHGTIEGSQKIQLEIHGCPVINLAGIDKKQGENGIWDTEVDQSGNIVNDKYLLIKDIQIDQVSMGILWIQALPLVNTVPHRPFNGGFWNNDCVQFQWSDPILEWIIDQKFCQTTVLDSNFFLQTNDLQRFDYGPIREKVAHIRKLLDDQNTNL